MSEGRGKEKHGRKWAFSDNSTKVRWTLGNTHKTTFNPRLKSVAHKQAPQLASTITALGAS